MDINEIRASTERSFDRWLAAISKFDYFLMTVAAGLLAYIAKDYHPHRLDSWLDFFEPVSMLLLVAAFTAGARRVHWAAHILFLEVEDRKCRFKIENYRPGLTSPGPGEDSVTGQAVGKVEAQETVDAGRARLKVIAEATSKAQKRAATFYRAQLRLLAAGILMLLVGRMLAPYRPAPTGTASEQQRPAATTGPTGAPAKPP
ncbi:MAG TPA: hypothetical protein VHQ90_22130 [Thermoanaerobaculia bacterium]|nr:hypothetical protein [Thermoanaerobaculia bacterium]